MSSKIIGHAWVSGLSTIGVIVTKDEVTGEYKGRMAPLTGMRDELQDLGLVHMWGAQIPLICAVNFVTIMGRWYNGDKPPADIWKDEPKGVGHT